MSKKLSFTRILLLIVMTAFIAAAVLLGLSFIRTGILPAAYLRLYVIVCLVAVVVTMHALLLNKRFTDILMSVLLLAAAAGIFFGSNALSKVESTLNQISSTPDTHINEVMLVVRSDDAAVDLKGLSGYKIAHPDTVTEAQLGTLKQELSMNGISNVDLVNTISISQTADQLLTGEVNAAFFPTSLYTLLVEEDTYSEFPDKIKVLLKLDIDEDSYASSSSSAVELAAETEQAPVPVEEVDPLNSFLVYISGIDAYGAIETESRSDVNILCAVNMTTHKIQLVTTPRDYYVELIKADGTDSTYKDKLTHCGLYGIDCSINSLENLYGDLPIKYYVRVNFSGFVDIIDALGGVDVVSPSSFTEHGYSYTEGDMHLNGTEAMWFVRHRKGFGESNRALLQMQVISSLVQKVSSSPELLLKYGTILESVSQSFQTNMTPDEMYTLVNKQLESGKGWDISSFAVSGEGNASSLTYSMYGTSIYVNYPDMSTVEEAVAKFNSVLNG